MVLLIPAEWQARRTVCEIGWQKYTAYYLFRGPKTAYFGRRVDGLHTTSCHPLKPPWSSTEFLGGGWIERPVSSRTTPCCPTSSYGGINHPALPNAPCSVLQYVDDMLIVLHGHLVNVAPLKSMLDLFQSGNRPPHQFLQKRACSNAYAGSGCSPVCGHLGLQAWRLPSSLPRG